MKLVEVSERGSKKGGTDKLRKGEGRVEGCGRDDGLGGVVLSTRPESAFS